MAWGVLQTVQPECSAWAVECSKWHTWGAGSPPHEKRTEKKKAAVNTHSRKGQSQDCKVVEKCSAEPQDGWQGSGGTWLFVLANKQALSFNCKTSPHYCSFVFSRPLEVLNVLCVYLHCIRRRKCVLFQPVTSVISRLPGGWAVTQRASVLRLLNLPISTNTDEVVLRAHRVRGTHCLCLRLIQNGCPWNTNWS